MKTVRLCVVEKVSYGCRCVEWKLFNCVSLNISVTECCHCVSETVCRMDTVYLTVCQCTLVSVKSRLSLCHMDRVWVCPTVCQCTLVYRSSVTVVAVSHENCSTVCRWTSSVTVVAMNNGASPTVSVYISVPKFSYGCCCVEWKLFNCVTLNISVSECCHCLRNSLSHGYSLSDSMSVYVSVSQVTIVTLSHG